MVEYIIFLVLKKVMGNCNKGEQRTDIDEM